MPGCSDSSQIDPHTTTWDGVWWAITTMTTVGYGGSPTTTLGRIITIGVLVVGIGFVAVLTGAVAQRFLASQIEDVAVAADEVEATDAEVLAELREVKSQLARLEIRLSQRALSSRLRGRCRRASGTGTPLLNRR